MLKVLFVREIFQFFCPNFCGHVGKRLDKKDKIDLKIYYVTDWITNNYNTHTSQ